MSLSADDIRAISGWLADAGLAALDLAGPGVSLRLRRCADGTVADIGEIETAARTDRDVDAVLVRSPIAGTFLTMHPMRNDRMIETGEPVAKGQTIALVAVGTLLVPVDAPQAGVVAAVFREDGSLVGYGDPLVEIQSG